MRKVVRIFLFLFCCQGASGQSAYLQKFLFPEKNQSIQVNAMIQTRSGYLWIGTDHGLFKFDGINFQSFIGANKLPDDNITALAEDSIGRIWMGHKSGKISIYENNTARALEPEEGLSTKPISKILFDQRGILWFATLNDGLYYYRNSRLYRLDDIDGMPDIFVYDIAEDSNGNIWAGTDGGIAICSVTEKEIKINTISSAQGLPDNIVKKINITKNKAWFVTEDAGVVSCDLQTRKVEKTFANWSFGKAIDILPYHDQLWIATDQGLLSSDLAGNLPHVIKTENITTLFKDTEDNLWMGLKNGFIRTLGNKIQFIQPEGNKKLDIIAVTADNANTIWFAAGEGLFKRSSSGVIQKQLVGTKYEKSNIISLYFDSLGSCGRGFMTMVF